MSRHDHSSFDTSNFFQMPKSEGKGKLNGLPPVKGEWFDKAGIRHQGTRMSASWQRGRGVNHNSTPPQPSS